MQSHNSVMGFRSYGSSVCAAQSIIRFYNVITPSIHHMHGAYTLHIMSILSALYNSVSNV